MSRFSPGPGGYPLVERDVGGFYTAPPRPRHPWTGAALGRDDKPAGTIPVAKPVARAELVERLFSRTASRTDIVGLSCDPTFAGTAIELANRDSTQRAISARDQIDGILEDWSRLSGISLSTPPTALDALIDLANAYEAVDTVAAADAQLEAALDEICAGAA